MKKLLSLALAIMLVVLCCVGCANNNADNATTMTSTVDDDGRIAIKGDQLKDITEASEPVGVFDVEIISEKSEYQWSEDYFYYLKGKINKNSKTPEVSDVILNYVVYDKNQEMIDEIVVVEENLVFGDTVEFKELITGGLGEREPVSYELIMVREADHKAEVEKDEVERAIREINEALENEQYNLAETVLNEIKEKYPDNKEIKRIEAIYKDKVN